MAAAETSDKRLAGFPPERADRMQTTALLAERGFFLRTLGKNDLPWLGKLYANTRADEMAPVPWPEDVKRTFLDQQFALQHHHYLTYFMDTDFLAIEHIERGPVGRYYLLRAAPNHQIIDISLLSAERGSGVGSALIRQSQQEAAALNRGIQLHVNQFNPAARRLYERLGFVSGNLEGAYWPMHWRP